MRTKKGDIVRVCTNGKKSFNWQPGLSFGAFRVVKIQKDGRALITGGGWRYVIKSWVRCADMKEGGK